MLTQEELKKQLKYNPDTGQFTWVASGFCKKIGKVAGTITRRGYNQIGVNGKIYKASRLAWLYMTGDWPIEVDHKDLDKSNDTWSNLRACTRAQNCANKPTPITNTSGLKGVRWNDCISKYEARIRINGKLHFLGYFDDKNLAKQVHREFADKMLGEFARHS